MKNLDKYSTIIFDLDNTLYNEIEYLINAYRFISENISSRNHSCPPNEIFNFILNEFKINGRKNLYQKTVDKFSIGNYSLNEFLNDMRIVPIPENSIKINSKLYSFVKDSIDKFNIFIVTNGTLVQQKNKIRSVDIPCKDQIKIIYCDSFGIDKRKPDPYFIEFLTKEFKINRNEMIFIGDGNEDQLSALRGKIDFLFIDEFRNKFLNHN